MDTDIQYKGFIRTIRLKARVVLPPQVVIMLW